MGVIKVTTKIKRLTASEEASLAQLAQAGDQKAMDMLVQRNVPLVYHIARRFKGSLTLDDRVQEGITGLIKAAERFNPKRRVRFGTYASWWIWQAISRAIADQSRDIRIPVHMHVRLRKLKRQSEELNRKLGRNPTVAELADETGLSPDQVSSYRRIGSGTVPLSDFASAGNDSTAQDLGDGAAHHQSPEGAVMHELLKGNVARTLRILDARERYVIGRHYGLFGGRATNMNGIARELGLSRERVRQIVKQALGKLRECDQAEGLRDFY